MILVFLGWRGFWDAGLLVPNLGKSRVNWDELTTLIGGQCGVREARRRECFNKERG